MTAPRRDRIGLYVGPRASVEPADLDRLEATGEWLFEEKHDGCWCLAVVEGGVLSQLTSRTGAAFGAGAVAGLTGRRAGRGSGRVVGEILADEDACRLVLFDVLDWNGHDLRGLPQAERREALLMVCAAGLADGDRVRPVEQRASGARAFYEEVVARRGEGVVAKRRDAVYQSATADGKVDAWVRCKRNRTVDYVVVGIGSGEKGTPTAELGLFVNGELRRVQSVVIPPAWKIPHADLVGRVVEALGFKVFPSGALWHARLSHRAGPRDDKFPEDCTLAAALEA